MLNWKLSKRELAHLKQMAEEEEGRTTRKIEVLLDELFGDRPVE